jgi:DNA-binding SARP family transcriptional activator/tetratricopeptide (TPR) repeat protein
VLRVRLFGRLELHAADEPIVLPAGRRACELLAWLALNPGEHPRGTLAATFWPDVLDTSARASLRSATWAVRKALAQAGAGDALLATRDRVGLHCTTDVQRFDELVDQDRLDEALALDHGPLLADFDEDWVLEARDRHAQRLSAVLARLAETAPTPNAAVEHARRRCALDPRDETAARDLMHRLVAAGDRPGALAVFDRLSDRLRAQLGIAPSPETRELAARIRAGPEAGRAAAARGAAPAAPTGSVASPFVGREAELAELVRVTTSASGAVAVLSGEAGIGKTRLAAELLAHARNGGARTASCAALELGAPAPFQLWAELLRDLACDLPLAPAQARWPDELAAIAPSLPQRVGRTAPPPAPAAAPTVTPELARARLFEAVVDLLEHASADRPLILLFEDVHAADPPSLELLNYALRRLGDVATVLTRRQVPARPDLDTLLQAHRARGGPVTEIALKPLERRDVDRLIRQTAELDAPTRDRVAGAADGNPLLAVESARAAAVGVHGPAPSLQAAVAAVLTPSARRIAELAAVAGRPLTHAELDRLGTTSDDALAALETGLFTTDRAGFGFRHQLLLDAARAQLPVPRARALHAQLAAAIAGPAAEVAHHHRAAGEDDAAAARLADAAAEALRVGAVNEASAFLREALELKAEDPALLLDLAHAYAYNGLRTEAEETLARALRRIDPDDHAARGAAHLRAARWYAGVLCWPRRTVQEAGLALDELNWVPETDARTVAQALALAAWAEAAAGDPQRAEHLLRRFAALDVEDPDLRYEIAHARACLALRAGRLEESMDHFAECIAAGGGSPDSIYAAWTNRAALAAALGRIDDALDHADRGLEAIHEFGDLPPLVVPVHALRAALLARVDRLDEARAAITAERVAAERSGAPELLALADHDEGMLCVTAGEYERGAELIERALEGEAPVSRPLARLARAEALARADRPEDAERELRAVTLEPVRAVDRAPVLVARLTHVQGLIAISRGDTDLAARRLEEAADAWRRLPGAGEAGELLANLVDLGRPTLGPVEPARELERVTGELRRLVPVPN